MKKKICPVFLAAALLASCSEAPSVFHRKQTSLQEISVKVEHAKSVENVASDS